MSERMKLTSLFSVVLSECEDTMKDKLVVNFANLLLSGPQVNEGEYGVNYDAWYNEIGELVLNAQENGMSQNLITETVSLVVNLLREYDGDGFLVDDLVETKISDINSIPEVCLSLNGDLMQIVS